MYVFVSGCITGIAPHLPELIPFLINSLSEKRVSTVLYDLRCLNFIPEQVSFIQNKHWNDLYGSKMSFRNAEKHIMKME